MFIFIDNNPVSKFFNEHLVNESENEDYKAICFEEATEALNYIAPLQAVSSIPIYIFIKMDMPAMSAWEFIERCEQINDNKKFLNIVLMTKEELNTEEEIKLSKHSNVSTKHSFEITKEYFNELLIKQESITYKKSDIST